jgi:hypothetical protein
MLDDAALGELEQDRGRLAEARRHYLAAYDGATLLVQNGSNAVAETLRANVEGKLGEVDAAEHNFIEARRRLTNALEALELLGSQKRLRAQDTPLIEEFRAKLRGLPKTRE